VLKKLKNSGAERLSHVIQYLYPNYAFS
jgi:hypothetical protein